MELQHFKERAKELTIDIQKLCDVCYSYMRPNFPKFDNSIVERLASNKYKLEVSLEIQAPDKNSYSFITSSREVLGSLTELGTYLAQFQSTFALVRNVPSVGVEYRRIIFFHYKLTQDFKAFIFLLNKSGISLYAAVIDFQYIQSRPTHVDLFEGLSKDQISDLQSLIRSSYSFTELISGQFDIEELIRLAKELRVNSSSFTSSFGEIELSFSIKAKVLEIALCVETECLVLLEVLDKNSTDISIDNTLLDINKRYSEFESYISKLQETATTEYTAYKSQFDKLIERLEPGQDVLSSEAIEKTYSARSKDEKKAANYFRAGAIGTVSFAIIFAICQLKSGDIYSSNVFEMIYRLGITFLLLALAGYLAKESSKHRELCNTFDRLDLDMAAFRPFISLLDNEEQNNLTKKMAYKVFLAESELLRIQESSKSSSSAGTS